MRFPPARALAPVALALLALPAVNLDAEPSEPGEPGEPRACTSASSCSRYVACFAGFTKLSIDRKWLCERKVGARSRPPRCGPHAGTSDWHWSARANKCSRRRASGAVDYSAANIRCPDDHRFDEASGSCRRPGKTIYAETALSDSTVSAKTPSTCAKADSCAKSVACPAGYTRFTSGNKYYCAAPSGNAGKTSYRPARLR